MKQDSATAKRHRARGLFFLRALIGLCLSVAPASPVLTAQSARPASQAVGAGVQLSRLSLLTGSLASLNEKTLIHVKRIKRQPLDWSVLTLFGSPELLPGLYGQLATNRMSPHYSFNLVSEPLVRGPPCESVRQ